MPLSCFTYFHSKKFGSFHCKVTSSKQTKPWSINVFLFTATIKVKDLKFYCDSEFSFVRFNRSTITWNWKVKVLRDNVTNNEAICNLLVMELIHSYKQDFLEVGKKKIPNFTYGLKILCVWSCYVVDSSTTISLTLSFFIADQSESMTSLYLWWK